MTTSKFKIYNMTLACSSTFVVTLDWGCANNTSKAFCQSRVCDEMTTILILTKCWDIELLSNNVEIELMVDTKEKYTSFLSQKTNWHITEKYCTTVYMLTSEGIHRVPCQPTIIHQVSEIWALSHYGHFVRQENFLHLYIDYPFSA